MLLLFGLFALGFGIYWLMGYLTVTVFPMKKDRGITILLMVFINTVFLGFPIIEGLYGSEAIFAASLSTIIFNVLLYTAGVATLTRDSRGSFSFRELLSEAPTRMPCPGGDREDHLHHRCRYRSSVHAYHWNKSGRYFIQGDLHRLASLCHQRSTSSRLPPSLCIHLPSSDG